MNRVVKPSVKSSRSRPVSCHFCRSRKLKCSRQFPCSNCTSRGTACQLYPTASSPDLQSEKEEPPANQGSDADLLARLRRLEEIVIGNGKASGPLDRATIQAPSVPSPPTRQFEHPYMMHQGQSSAAAVNWLEGEITSPGSTSSLLKYELEFRICEARSALSSSQVAHPDSPRKKCLWLPRHEEAKIITDKYISELTHLHHVVHVPSLRTMIDDLYDGLKGSKPIKVGQISLLMSVLATTTTFWTERDMHYGIFSSVKEANSQSTQWMKLATEVLEYSRYKHLESLEDVQAMVILIFVTTNLVGIASQARHMVSTAISVARELSMHRVDHPNNTGFDVPPPTSARAEIYRRVWWYLVATDWQMSQLSGPQRGTYSIMASHMMTNKPANTNDEDVFDGIVANGEPMDHPTSMSYCLQRIRLGEFCREITDSAQFGISDPGTPDYAITKHIDSKICEFAESLPSFFTLSQPEQLKADDRRSTGIITQRYILNFLLNTQRCRLHLPYLSHASEDPAYEYSQKACLEAARMVIRTEQQLSQEVIPFVIARLKFSGMLHCVCVAIIVLLIAYCGRNSHQQEKEGGRSELFEAFKILEEAKGQSPFAGRLLESFKTVLRRHSASALPGAGDQLTQSGQASTLSLAPDRICYSTAPAAPCSSGQNDDLLMDPTLPALDDLWQVFDESVDSPTVDWTSFFAELDSPFLSVC
ncbi:unnamed protein product [Penicillium salamii]|nr:unnamed protein product [Penicillium salamii]CAG8402811.1 unnamed protein product [Penicillium salamii]